MATRWGSLQELADTSGLTTRALQYIRKNEPGVLVARPGTKGNPEYNLGTCNENLRRRERQQAEAKNPKADDEIRDAERRRALAQAAIEEHKLAELRRALIGMDEHRREVEELLMHVRAALLAHPKTRESALEILAALQRRKPPALRNGKHARPPAA